MLDPSDVMAGRILTLVREITRLIMRVVAITFLHLRPGLFFLRSTCFYFSFSQMEAGTIEFGTGAEFAFQRIGHNGYSLGLG